MGQASSPGCIEARELQLALVPRSVCADPRLGRWSLSTRFHTADVTGGDFYDYFFVDDHCVLFFLGRIPPSGVSASICLIQTLTLLRAWSPLCSSPGRLLETVNQSLCDNHLAGTPVHLGCGMVDLRTGEVNLVRAGGEAPLFASPTGASSLVFRDEGPLGVYKERTYREEEFTLSPRGQLMLLSSAPAQPAQQIAAQIDADPGEFCQAHQSSVLTLARPLEQIQSLAVQSSADLPQLHQALSDCLTAWGLSVELRHDLMLIAEELTSNAFTHGDAQSVQLGWHMLGDFVELSVRDNGQPFDPLEVVLSTDVLGLHLVHNIADQLTYRRVGNDNVTSVRRRR